MAITDAGAADLGEATRLVHESPIWADRRDQDDALNHAFWQDLASRRKNLTGWKDRFNILADV